MNDKVKIRIEQYFDLDNLDFKFAENKYKNLKIQKVAEDYDKTDRSHNDLEKCLMYIYELEQNLDIAKEAE